ncbi:MAG: hypothetical protein ACR2FG_07175 [Marmoricola sp.]
MSRAPREFERILDQWRPEPEVVEGELCRWPADALSAFLGGRGLGHAGSLPPLWHELYLHRVRAVAELGEEGHPVDGSLLPPLLERRRMFAGGTVTLDEPMRLGERAKRTSSVQDIRVREGRSGWLLIVTEQHLFSADGVPRVRDQRDIIYRLPADMSRSVAPRAVAGPTTGRPMFRLDVDERMLFMFSALTYNAHRIHYDRRYAVDVEGHADLLVHGPLLAIGAIEAARRTCDAQISTVSYRLLAPSYPGSPIEFYVQEDGASRVSVRGVQSGVAQIEAGVVFRG